LFLSLSYIHVVGSMLTLTSEESTHRSCPASSLAAILTAVLLLVSVVATMVVKTAQGYVWWVEAINTVVGIGAGSILQMLAKHPGFHASANSIDTCSMLVYSPALMAWFIGEASAFLSGAIVFLRWRRAPPFDLPKIPVLIALSGGGVGIYFLISLVVSPALSDAYDSNATQTPGIVEMLVG